MKEKPVFYLSDSTALTAKILGKSLLSLFHNLKVIEFWRPFLNNKEKLLLVIEEINSIKNQYQKEPIIFVSIINKDWLDILHKEFPNYIDILDPFIDKLEKSLNMQSQKQVGLAHKPKSYEEYDKRIETIDFCLNLDDGLNTQKYNEADIILLGLSRCGKTPTAIFLALQFGLLVANYPFTQEDLPKFTLNEDLKQNKQKLFGLYIEPERLLAIRKERRALGAYSNINTIKKEIEALNKLYISENIQYINTTNKSVEEISSAIVFQLQGKR